MPNAPARCRRAPTVRFIAFEILATGILSFEYFFSSATLAFANASIEQATGIEQINKALTQMDEVTQQNSALVEENAATAKTLEHQAKAMDEQVAFFQIGSGNDTRASSAPQAREPMARPEPREVAAPPSRGPAASKPKPVAAARPSVVAASGGGARRMQTALATAVNADTDWKEF